MHLEKALFSNCICLIEAFFLKVPNMADDFDVEAMLEAPYRKEVSWRTTDIVYKVLLHTGSDGLC